jgi:methylphosphotriester-DNA--protein-cysteine methyltransferase
MSITSEVRQPTVIVALDEDARWTAVLRRDASLDGVFWYGVRSTGLLSAAVSVTPAPP